jgi:hypothetical protein
VVLGLIPTADGDSDRQYRSIRGIISTTLEEARRR